MDGTRDLHDYELDAAAAETLAIVDPQPLPPVRECCAATAAHCAAMLNAYVDEALGGYLNRKTAAALREIAGSMARMGVRV